MRTTYTATVFFVSLACAFSAGAAWADNECKTSEDCAILGPACCTGECSPVTKKELKRAKKALDASCAKNTCSPPKGVAPECSAPVVCARGKCELGHVKAWDADKKKDAKPGDKKSDGKSDGKSAEPKPAE